MKDFRELIVWQKAHRLTLDVYAATRSFPREELYGITGQARRACASIPANIAEGCGRSGDPEFARFLDSPRRVILEVTPSVRVGYDGSKMHAATEEARAAGMNQ